MFKTPAQKDQKRLQKAFFNVAMSMIMDKPVFDLSEEVGAIKARITPEEYSAAFDKFWSDNRGVLADGLGPRSYLGPDLATVHKRLARWAVELDPYG